MRRTVRGPDGHRGPRYSLRAPAPTGNRLARYRPEAVRASAATDRIADPSDREQDRSRSARWSLWLADLGVFLAGLAQVIPDDYKQQLVELLITAIQSL
jgi:hypothetical protein